MRKKAGVGIALSIALALGLSAPPAGAAPKTACKTIGGTAKFAPAFPRLGNNKKVAPTMSAAGVKIGGCAGSVASATATLNAKFAKVGNCTTLGAGAANTASGKLVVSWNTGKTSTVAVTLSTVSGKPTTLKIAGTVSVGLFKGAKVAGAVIYTPSGGGCTKTALAKATFKQTTPLVFK